ncbi:MAG: DUF2971 domain-containing protein [Terracidiphilus sp.]
MGDIAVEGSAAGQPNELLYHYTTVESFVSIMNGGELWASHGRCQNDTSEQRLIWDLVRAHIKARLEAASAGDRERLVLFQSLAACPLELDLYLLCFSKDGGDTLSQWRGYGGNAGVAIGFDPDELEKRCSDFTKAMSQNQPHPMGWAFLLDEVRYIEPTGDEQSRQVIDIIIDNPEPTEHESRFSQEEVFSRRISLSSSRLKHKAFQEEKEWRIAIFDVPAHFVKFRSRRSMMIPYVPFDLGKGRSVWPVIRRVVVGPSPHQIETIAATRKRLDDRVAVVGSSIPYRDW